ncbi:MAG: ABC transporter ATP-binding protein/permease [Deltaproteobacteria bacterium]|nr:ABC transporter ATP-binding protein/permease [Deltaproteobacteria bacterium]
MARRTHFDATETFRRTNQFKTLITLASHLWPKRRPDLKLRVTFALIAMVLAKAIGVYVPFLYKNAVDALSVEIAILTVPITLVIAYGVARLLNQSLGELRDFIFAKVSQHAQRTIGLSTFKHLHNLSLAFHLDRQTGGISRVIERGIQGINFVLNFMMFNIIPTLLEIVIVTTVFLVKFDYRFALIVFGTISSYIIFTMWFTEWRLQYRRRMNEKDSEANTRAIDSLINYETVKYFNNEEHEYKYYDDALAGYEKAAIKNITTLSFLNIGQAALIAVGLITIMLMAGKGVVTGIYTIGDFVLVNTFLIQLYLPLNFLGFVYRQIKQSLTDMDKMFELLDVSPQIQNEPDAITFSPPLGKVEFKNVCFSYTDDRRILNGISFTIPPGNTLAIVGSSGEGKSTISRLLFRFYDINSGQIKIDDKDVKSITLDSLRAAIGIVPQDTVLFNNTIHYNLQYGRPNASKTEIIQAAQIAKIEAFIQSLPDQYQSKVGERGLKLSGGEKQRSAIARTILKNPKILIFDEATSALDSQTENDIQISLKEVSKNKTTLVIAHRLSTIVDADEILVLQDGKITERGRHSDLIALNGIYASMWARQQEAKEYQTKLDKVLKH